jgi:galactose mutarotase-like enzyme
MNDRSPLIPTPPQDAPPKDLVPIGAPGGLDAAIDPLGAQLWFLRDRDGGHLLWNGNPDVWSGRAPILFPIVGRLRDDSYQLDGHIYHLPRHGFARHARFTLGAHDDNHALFRLEDNAETRAAYPFAFALTISYAISGNTLTIGAEVANRGDTPMPFSFGFHPALRWPLPHGGLRAAHHILFDQPEAPDVARLDANGLLASSEPSPLEGQELRLRDALFEQDALIFPEVNSRAFTYTSPGGPAIRLQTENLPDLGIWTKPDADFICIEPWQGHADAEDFAGDIFQKPGMLTLPPGEVWKASVSLTHERSVGREG